MSWLESMAIEEMGEVLDASWACVEILNGCWLEWVSWGERLCLIANVESRS